MTHSGKEIGSYNETMQNITIVYDGIKGWYDAYVDGKLKAEHFAGTSYADKVAHFALIFAATGASFTIDGSNAACLLFGVCLFTAGLRSLFFVLLDRTDSEEEE